MCITAKQIESKDLQYMKTKQDYKKYDSEERTKYVFYYNQDILVSGI